jgi:predicted ribosome quality control (RQC) complex YloA/Tae2 family protein
VGAITPRLEAHRQRLAWLEASLTFLEQAETVDQLRVLEEELRQEGAGGGSCLGKGSRGPSKRAGPGKRARRRQADGEAPPEATPQPLELRTAGGVRVQVGRNHRQNEWISLRQARRGDLWFHAQECPGSHVVLKGSEQPVGQADLMAAADLAALFSRARGNVRVPVVMVPAEELQRIPGAAAGTVRHRGGEILWGEPDRARLLLEPTYALGGGPP